MGRCTLLMLLHGILFLQNSSNIFKEYVVEWVQNTQHKLVFNTLNCETYCCGMSWKHLVFLGSEKLHILTLNAKTSLELKRVFELPLAEIRRNAPEKWFLYVYSSVIFYWASVTTHCQKLDTELGTSLAWLKKALLTVEKSRNKSSSGQRMCSSIVSGISSLNLVCFFRRALYKWGVFLLKSAEFIEISLSFNNIIYFYLTAIQQAN